MYDEHTLLTIIRVLGVSFIVIGLVAPILVAALVYGAGLKPQ